MKLKLNSEFGTLKAVLMHRPGNEIDRLEESTHASISSVLTIDKRDFCALAGCEARVVVNVSQYSIECESGNDFVRVG